MLTKLRIAIFVGVVIYALIPTTDCTGLTSQQCERSQLIDAGAID